MAYSDRNYPSTEWYTPQEVAQLFRVDPKTVIRWEASGKLALWKIQVERTNGNHRRYRRTDVDRAFEERNGE